MLQIEGLIFATDNVNFAPLSKWFVYDDTEVTLVAYDSDPGNPNSLKQMKIHILCHQICLDVFKRFIHSSAMCGVPVNRNSTITKVSNSINLPDKTIFILGEYNSSLLKIIKTHFFLFQRTTEEVP